MIDIKNPAPFYTLKETTEYFNNKYNQCTFSDSYLLKQLLAFNIHAHIYSFGLNPYGSEFFFKKDLLRRTDPDWSEWVDKRDSILPDFVEFLHNESCKTGLFLELKHKDLVQVCMQNQVITHVFKDVIPFDYITISSSLREVIDDMWKATSNYYKNKKPDALIQKEIDNMKELFDNFVSVEEFISTTDMQEISSKSKRQYLNVKPEIIVVDEIIGHLKEFCFLKIISEDIFILRNNLLLLEKYLTGDELYVQSQKPLIKITQQPKGKSREKANAQLAAQTLANYLWNQDKGNKIKIKEMAIQVHAELNQTEHREQLPDQSVSLKKWIENIAPEYAREAGSPKEL